MKKKKSLHLLGTYFLALCSLVVAVKPLSDDTLRNRLPRPNTADFDIHNGPILAPILIPRVPDTPGSRAVLQHFVDYFKSSLPDWTIELHNSTFKTPVHGTRDVRFTNFIATRKPSFVPEGNVGYLTLVAHYDSKYSPTGFVGATDSAAPCAMIMHAVRAIDAALTKKWDDMKASGIDFDLEEDQAKGIQVLFLDGEEAFKSWSDTDSIYGARALAEEWDATTNAAGSTHKNRLNSIDLFVLLDLLGTSEYRKIPSWIQSTQWAYQHLSAMEKRLRDLGIFKSKSDLPWLPDHNKTTRFNSWAMQDDHIPFINRGVPVLHLIPEQFPSVWHTMDDDAEHLHIPTVEDWALLTTAFTAEYLELEGYFDTAKVLPARQNIISKTEL